MLKQFLGLLLILGLSIPVFSQQKLAGDLAQEDRDSIWQIEDTLSVLSYTFLNDSLSQNRFGAVRKFIFKKEQGSTTSALRVIEMQFLR